MKQIVIGSTAVFAFAVPAGASEFDFRGAEITGTGYYNMPEMFPVPALQPFPFPASVDDPFTSVSVGASVEIGHGHGFFSQVDAAFAAYDTGWGDFKLGSIGKHLGYEIGPDTAVGVFSYAELWDQPNEGDMSLGMEIAGQSGAVFYEGYGAYLFDPLNGTGWEQYHVEGTAGYAFNSGLSVEAGLHYASGDMRYGRPGNSLQALANVSYEVMPDFAVELGYVYTDFETDLWPSWKSHGIKLALTKQIGGGTTFDQRNYFALHNGY